jgi:hypothetical protein
MTRPGREADRPAPDVGDDAAPDVASAARRLVPELRTGWDARHAGIARRQRSLYGVRIAR